jgi:rhodanese-related sulfurtransferase
MVSALAGSVEEIFPWDLIDELESNPEVLLLDIRCPHEFETAGIENSVNVPRGILEIAADYGYEETEPQLVEARNKRVISICRSGNRSILAAYTLNRMGFDNVASLRTGIRGWNDYEQPLYTSQGQCLTLDEADELLESRISPEQMGQVVNA